MTSRARANDRKAAHWRALCLTPGAPECVIRAAHRYYIEQHHPDRGGKLEDAQRINVANDELRDAGAAANEYVAANYNGEPWLVLGLAANAPADLATRAAKALERELGAHRRLAERVAWAIGNWGRAGNRPRAAPPPPPPPPARPAPRPRAPATPGRPEGLPGHIDLGATRWGEDVARDIRLTWPEHAPYTVRAETSGALRADVIASKVASGRFVVRLSLDWSALPPADATRDEFVDSLRLTWGGGGSAHVPVHVRLIRPAAVAVEPARLDFGTAVCGSATRATLILTSTAATSATIDCSAWLTRVDAAGQRVDVPVRLGARTQVRVSFAVDWAPIIARATRWPVRPTGKVTIRWDDREIDVPALMVAHEAPARAPRR